MATDTKVLIIVLGSVFGFLFAVFLFLILRFTFRVRTLAPSNTSTINPAASSTRAIQQGRQRSTWTMTPKEAAQQWKDRWSARTRGDASAVRGMDDDEMEAAIAAEDKESIVNDSTAGEFGATVHANGTRSFLNGWFALDSPPTVDASFRTHPARGKHERVQMKEARLGDEWEIKTEASDTSDPEAYRPPNQYATI